MPTKPFLYLRASAAIIEVSLTMSFPAKIRRSCLLIAASLTAALAQNAPAPPATVAGPSETMVVLGSATPVPLAESPRSIEVLPVAPMKLAAESPQDLLREDSSIFLQQRGAGGGQSDLVLRGGSFEQTLVLLNGFR